MRKKGAWSPQPYDLLGSQIRILYESYITLAFWACCNFAVFSRYYCSGNVCRSSTSSLQHHSPPFAMQRQCMPTLTPLRSLLTARSPDYCSRLLHCSKRPPVPRSSPHANNGLVQIPRPSGFARRECPPSTLHRANEQRRHESSVGNITQEQKKKQLKTPWHREGSDMPPVSRQRSAGAMTKGVHALPLHSFSCNN